MGREGGDTVSRCFGNIEEILGEQPWATWTRPSDGATMGMTAAGHSWVIDTPLAALERRVAELEARLDAAKGATP
jgi:hypothetical protein